MKLRDVDLSADKLSLSGRGLKRGALATVSLAALVPVFAAAQQTPAPASGKAFTLQDVVITARHRDERAQTVPILLTTLSSCQIHNIGSLNLDKIKRLVPSLTINGYNPRNTGLNIRSIGSVGFFGYDGLEGGVGTYVDGVFLGRPTSDDFDIPDLQNIEVLRGPQGTLFGKNTVAGAVVIHTKLPSLTMQSDFSASYGNYNYWRHRFNDPARAAGAKGAKRKNAAQNPTASGLGHDLFMSSVKLVAGVGFEPTTFRL